MSAEDIKNIRELLEGQDKALKKLCTQFTNVDSTLQDHDDKLIKKLNDRLPTPDGSIHEEELQANGGLPRQHLMSKPPGPTVHQNNISPGAGSYAWLGRDGHKGHYLHSYEPISYMRPTGEGTADCAAEVNRAFTQVKEGLNKVKLPEELSIHTKRDGIKADSRPIYSVIRQSADYTETAAKWMAEKMHTCANIDPRNVREDDIVLSEEDVRELFTILYAHATALRAEYTGILVKGMTDDEVAKNFKTMEKNPNCFTEKQMKHIQFASEIASLKPQRSQSSNNFSGQRRQYRNFSSARDYGNNRQGYKSNSNFQGSYNKFGKQFPQKRPTSQDSGNETTPKQAD